MWTLIALAVGIAVWVWPTMHRALRGVPRSNQDFHFY